MSSVNPDALVRARFKVLDYFELPEGESEYEVAYGPDSKGAFEQLTEELRPAGLSPQLAGTKEECTLYIRKKVPVPPSRTRAPVILVLLTFAAIAVFGILEILIYGKFGPGMPSYVVFTAYAAGVLVVLGAHEVGHRYVASKRRATPPTTFMIPGIPDVPPYLPAVGLATSHRGASLNRDTLFDVMIAGPLAALLATVILYGCAEFTSLQSAIPLAGNTVVTPYLALGVSNPSILQYALDLMFSPFTANVAPGFLKLSPLLDGASAGFLLSFVSLLPMSSFDGGFVSLAAWGGRASRAATYLSVLVLITFDTPNYWIIAIIVLLLAGRPVNVRLMDEVTDSSRNRKILAVVMVIVAFLCVPIPQNIATIPLG